MPQTLCSLPIAGRIFTQAVSGKRLLAAPAAAVSLLVITRLTYSPVAAYVAKAATALAQSLVAVRCARLGTPPLALARAPYNSRRRPLSVLDRPIP